MNWNGKRYVPFNWEHRNSPYMTYGVEDTKLNKQVVSGLTKRDQADAVAIALNNKDGKQPDEWWYVDKLTSDDHHLYIDLEGFCTVAIEIDGENLAVHLFTLHVSDDPVASIYTKLKQLIKEE